jgi:hypothetical protein
LRLLVKVALLFLLSLLPALLEALPPSHPPLESEQFLEVLLKDKKPRTPLPTEHLKSKDVALQELLAVYRQQLLPSNKVRIAEEWLVDQEPSQLHPNQPRTFLLRDLTSKPRLNSRLSKDQFLSSRVSTDN